MPSDIESARAATLTPITDVAAAYSRKYYEVQDHMTVVPVLAAAAFTHLFHIVARTEIARRAQTGRIRGG